MPCSLARRLAMGEAGVKPGGATGAREMGGKGAWGTAEGGADTAVAVDTAAGGPAAGAAPGAGVGGGAAGGVAPREASSFAMSSFASAMIPMVVPAGTVAPTETRIFRSTPLALASISWFTLSVSISKRGSPCFTASPSLLSHWRILASSMVCPKRGRKTSVAIGSSVRPLDSLDPEPAPTLTHTLPLLGGGGMAERALGTLQDGADAGGGPLRPGGPAGPEPFA